MKIFVALTESSKKVAVEIASIDDVILYSGKLYGSICDKVFCVDGALSKEDEQKLCLDIANQLAQCTPEDAELIENYSNGIYAYVLKPLAEYIASIAKVLSLYTIDEVVVLGPSPLINNTFPFLFVRNLESKAGSAILLPAYICGFLLKLSVAAPIKHLLVDKRDFWSLPALRRLILLLISCAAACWFILKVIYSKLFIVSESVVKDVEVLFIARARHHVRFVRGISQSLDSQKISNLMIFVPQFFQEGVFSVASMLRPFSNGKVIMPSIYGLLINFVCIHFRALSRSKSKGSTALFTFSIREQSINIPVVDVVNELNSIPILGVYRIILLDVIKKMLPVKKLITFELVGRQAGIEHYVAKSLGVKLYGIQTALVAARPHVVFPYADVFYADSPASANALISVGAIRKGCVRYGGHPFAKISKNIVATREKVIVFFTQPYEHDYTVELLLSLMEWVDQSEMKLLIKLHPRDNFKLYPESIRSELASRVIVGLEITDVFAISDIVITRTSSVAKESIAVGVPTFVCLLSQLDRSIKVDYLTPITGVSHVCHSAKELLSCLMMGEGGLRKQVIALNDFYFEGKSLSNLVSSIVDDDVF